MDSNSFIQLPQLNFPEKYHFRLKKCDAGIQIFCPLRKKWFLNTPEEWVRQHVIQYLHQNLNYSLSTLIAEYPVTLNKLNQRIDLLVLQKGQPYILIECKKPGVKITQSILDQAMRYSSEINASFIFLTNGMYHSFFKCTDLGLERIAELPSIK